MTASFVYFSYIINLLFILNITILHYIIQHQTSQSITIIVECIELIRFQNIIKLYSEKRTYICERLEGDGKKFCSCKVARIFCSYHYSNHIFPEFIEHYIRCPLPTATVYRISYGAAFFHYIVTNPCYHVYLYDTTDGITQEQIFLHQFFASL